MKIAKERKSSVLASNAVHHRIDSLTSIVALLTIGGAHVIADASWLDPIGGLIISAMVIRAGWQNTYTALLELADTSVEEDIKRSVRQSVMKALSEDDSQDLPSKIGGSEIQIKDIQGTKSGQNYLMDIELAVPDSYTVVEAAEIERAVRQRVGAKVRGVRRVRVRFSATNSSHDMSEFIAPDVSPRGSPEPEQHDHDHNDEHHSHAHEQNSKDNISRSCRKRE